LPARVSGKIDRAELPAKRIAEVLTSIPIVDSVDQMRHRTYKTICYGVGICRAGEPIGNQPCYINRTQLRLDQFGCQKIVLYESGQPLANSVLAFRYDRSVRDRQS